MLIRNYRHYSLAVVLSALIAVQVLAQGAARLTPRADVELQPVRVDIPPQFSHLPDTLSVNLPPGFRARVYAAFETVDRPRFMAFDDHGVLHVANMDDDEIVALPDHDGDGFADEAIVVAAGFERPHSLGFYDGDLYVGDRGQIVRFMDADDDGIYEQREVFADDIPSSGGHSTRTLIIDEPGGKMYLGVGWPCDLCRRNDGAERGAVLQFNLDGSGRRVYANGMRNPIGLAIHPATGELWGTNNGHDLEGVDSPPEWIDIIRDGSFHGMPFAYGYQVWADFTIPAYRDEILPLTAADSALVATMEPPVALVPAHTAPMDIHFYDHDHFPARYRHAAFVALHAGHAKLAPIEGYSVVTLFSEPDGSNARVADFMTGFQTGTEVDDVWGYPMGITSDAAGRLYVSSDLGNPLILRLEHSPLVATWRHDIPDSLGPRDTFVASGSVRIERVDPEGPAPEATADLSQLGGLADVSLRRGDDGTFGWLFRMAASGAPPGLKTVAITVRQEASPRAHVVRLTQQVALLPREREDLVIFGEELAPGWQVLHQTFVEERGVDLNEDGIVHSGTVAAGFRVFAGNWDWVVRFRPESPVDPLGFEKLRFAFHAGLFDRDPTDDFNIYVAGRLIDLVEEGYVDITSKEWQIVDVQLAAFGPPQPIKEATFGGDFSRRFYLDDVRLVAGAPITAVTDDDTTPDAYQLGSNYPNPFNSGTVIPYDLDVARDVRLSIYNLAGQRVGLLVDGPRTPGHHDVPWSGRHDDGQTLASGVYFYRLRSAAGVVTRKLVLVR